MLHKAKNNIENKMTFYQWLNSYPDITRQEFNHLSKDQKEAYKEMYGIYKAADIRDFSPKYIVETMFEYKKLHCLVLFYEHGYRCGYVIIPKSHKLYGIEDLMSLNIEIDVPDLDIDYSHVFEEQFKHEGVDVKTYNNLYGQWVLGFSCNHLGDAADFDMLEKYFPDSEQFKCESGKHGEIKTTEYIIRLCKKIVDNI